MKKFLNIRNILIILILVVAVVFIYWGRSDSPKDSKAYKLFTHFNNYGPEYGNTENNTIMKLHYKGENKEITIIYATDYDNEKEVRSFETIDNTTPEWTYHFQTVNITTKEGMVSYNMDHKEKSCIMFGTSEDQASEFYAKWAEDFMNVITNSPYYTRGYEFVNGNLMYYEYFKETDSKFYFNKDNELVYLSTESLSNSIETNPKEAYIFEVTISHDSIDNSLIEIPEGYEVKNAEEME